MIMLVLAGILGAALGSFANVLIFRAVSDDAGFWQGRSKCVQCHREIAPYDLIPILSYLLLLGRCRFCKKAISPQYPLVETMMAGLAVLSVLRWGTSWPAVEFFVFCFFVLVVLFIDLKHWLIPVGWVLFFWVAGLLLGLVVDPSLFWSRLIGSVGTFVFFYCVLVVSTFWLRKRGRLGPDEFAMGHGDPILMGGIAAFINVGQIPVILLLAAFQGLIYFAVLARVGQRKELTYVPPKSALPFGAFLCLGAFEIVLIPQLPNVILSLISDFTRALIS